MKLRTTERAEGIRGPLIAATAVVIAALISAIVTYMLKDRIEEPPYERLSVAEKGVIPQELQALKARGVSPIDKLTGVFEASITIPPSAGGRMVWVEASGSAKVGRNGFVELRVFWKKRQIMEARTDGAGNPSCSRVAKLRVLPNKQVELTAMVSNADGGPDSASLAAFPAAP